MSLQKIIVDCRKKGLHKEANAISSVLYKISKIPYIVNSGGSGIKTFKDFSDEEKKVAKRFHSKGNDYVVQVEFFNKNTYKDFGDPIYLKDSSDLKTIFDTFKSYERPRIKWSFWLQDDPDFKEYMGSNY